MASSNKTFSPLHAARAVLYKRFSSKNRFAKKFLTQDEAKFAKFFLLLLGLVFLALGDYFSLSRMGFESLFIFLATLSACYQGRLMARLFTAAILIAHFFVDSHDPSLSTLVFLRNTGVQALVTIVTVETILRFRKAWYVAVTDAETDFLTGVPNKRGFEKRGAEILSYCRRKGCAVSLVEVDVDEFKNINDTFGHSAGDQVLVDVAKALSKNVRGFDIVARLGGDEFVILFPSLDRTNALAAVKRLKRVLDKAFGKSQLSITFSMGLITFNKAPLSVRDLLDPADALMYEVKKTGKNALRSEVARLPQRAVTHKVA